MRLGCALALFLIGGATAAADSISPTFDSWGSFSETTFDGREVTRDAVAVSTFVDEGRTITLALSVSPRSGSAPVRNDSAGTFFVAPGVGGGASDRSTGAATWDLHYYANVSDGSLIGNGYLVRLLYDFDPAVGTDVDQHGALLKTTFRSTVQGNENLTTFFPWIWSTPSPPMAFDPALEGEYTFAIQVLKATVESVETPAEQRTNSQNCCFCRDCHEAPDAARGLSWEVLDTAAVRVVSVRTGQSLVAAPDFGSVSLIDLPSEGFSGSFGGGFGGGMVGGGGVGNGFSGGLGGGVAGGFSDVPIPAVFESFPSQQPTFTVLEREIVQSFSPARFVVLDPDLRLPEFLIPHDDLEPTPPIDDGQEERIVATPEPSTLALVGMSAIGFGGRFAWRRRRRKH